MNVTFRTEQGPIQNTWSSYAIVPVVGDHLTSIPGQLGPWLVTKREFKSSLDGRYVSLTVKA
jgi:hypothetical protein